MTNSRDYYLRHMGLGEIWQLRDAPIDQPQVADSTLVPVAAPAATNISSEDPTNSWTNYLQNVRQCRACELCQANGQAPIADVAPVCDVLIVRDWPSLGQDANDQRAIDEERILQQLVYALGFRVSWQILNASFVKASFSGATSEEMLNLAQQKCRPFFEHEVQASKAKLILVFGENHVRSMFPNQVESELDSGLANSPLFRGIPVLVLPSLSAIIESASAKRATWSRLGQARHMLRVH